MSKGVNTQQIYRDCEVTMYLTPKGVEGAKTMDIVVTEYNTFSEVDGKLMVTRLDLYTTN